MDRFVRAIPFINRLYAAVTKLPECREQILAAASIESLDEIPNES